MYVERLIEVPLTEWLAKTNGCRARAMTRPLCAPICVELIELVHAPSAPLRAREALAEEHADIVHLDRVRHADHARDVEREWLIVVGPIEHVT